MVRMQRALVTLLAWLAILLCTIPAAHASRIGYTATALGGTQWRYDYAVGNTSLGVPIAEFTLFFSDSLYANLLAGPVPPGWDVLVAQPDAGIPASGYVDALALLGGIAPGATATGFSLTFDYLGGGSPGAQPFVIVDPVTFIQLETGVTQAVAIPLPATPCLLLAGVLALACLRRRQLAAAALALSLCACGGASDPPQPPSPKIKLAAGTQAAGPYEVTALRKTAERRVSRTIYEYTFRASIRNNGGDTGKHVRAVLAGTPPGTSIIDGEVQAGSITPGATVTPADAIVLRVERTRPFVPGGLVWDITASASVALPPVRPAQVVLLPLAELGMPDGADSVRASGAISDVLLRDGSVRFSTPGDTGSDQHAQLVVSKGKHAAVFDVLIRTEMPTAVQTHVEALDDGSLPAPPPALTITGLGPNNSLLPGGLALRLAGAPALDLQHDSDGFLAAPGGAAIGLKPYWVFHPDTGSFSISATAMRQLLAALPPGALDMHLNFVSRDGAFAASYALTVLHASSVLKGQMRTPAGGNASGLAGKKILLAGYNFHQRRVAVIDATGAFYAEGILPDTYQLTLNDLEHPNAVSISAAVFPDSTSVDVGIVYPYALAQGRLAASGPIVSGTATQDGAAPPARGAAAGPGPLSAAAPFAASGADSQAFTATAGAQNRTVSTPIAFAVPKGTRYVGVRISVSTAEYPVYTTQQSRYNDTWSYAVLGLHGASLAATGAVNQSHFTQGSIASTDCIDVGQHTAQGALAIGGSVSATNIGDDQLPTSIRVELGLACTGLKVSKAQWLSPNQDGHAVLQPLKASANLPGPYLSIAQGAVTPAPTLPLELQYTPVTATLTDVSIGISASGGDPAFNSGNLLAQASIQQPGKVTFPALVLPAFEGGKIDKKAVVTIRLKGRINGSEAVSEPAEGGQVALRGDTAFIPLYLAGNAPALAARRYGGRAPDNAGGDSWATRLATDWLLDKPYRFGDISGQHVAQTAAGRSLLGHSGHGDGQQIDMRYADGAGGYTDSLGGAGNGAAILQLINDAQAEVAAGAPQKPKLARLVAWIAANRAMLALEAADAGTRVIYVGHSFVKLALVDGRFAAPPHARIPGVPPWAKPARVSIDPAHLGHWHISLTAHP